MVDREKVKFRMVRYKDYSHYYNLERMYWFGWVVVLKMENTATCDLFVENFRNPVVKVY